MAADGSIIINTRLNTDGFREGTADMKKSFTGLGGSIKKIGAAIAGVFAVKEIIEFGKSAIKLGSDLQEAQNVVDSVFTTMSNRVDEFAKNAAATAGLSETMAKKYAGTFGAMAKSFGFAENEAFDMSTALTQLTGDVASFYNLTQDEAYTKLESVFTGETESLKGLGIVMTQTALDSYALANGFGKTTSAMTEQEKVALRYQFVMNQLATASGDFSRTSGGWANQVRVLKLQFESLKATIGAGLINIFTPVIKVINVLLAKLATVANAFKAFTELITGKSSSGQMTAADAGIDATGYTEAAESAQGVADATDHITNATKKAAKEQKKYLSGLDEIKTFGENTSYDAPEASSGAGGSSGGGTGSPGSIGQIDYGNVAEGANVLERTDTILSGILNQLQKMKELFKKGFWSGLGDYQPILKELQEDLFSIKDSLMDIWSSPEVKTAATEFLNVFSYSLGRKTGALANIGLNIGSFIVGSIESYLSQSKERIKDFLAGMFDVGSDISRISADFFEAISEIFSALGGQEIQNFAGTVLGIFSELGMAVLENCARIGRDIYGALVQPIIDNSALLKNAFTGLIAAVQPFADGVLNVVQRTRDKFSEFYYAYLKPFVDSIAGGLSRILTTLLNGYNAYVLPLIERLSMMLKEFVEGSLGELVDSVLGFLGTLLSNLQVIWNEILVPLVNWLIETILPIIVPIISILWESILGFFDAVTGVVSGILLTLEGLLNFVVGILTGDWGKAFGGMQQATEGFWKRIDAIFSYIKDTVLGPFLDFLQSVFKKDWSESFGSFGEILNLFFDDVEEIWENIKGACRDIISFIKNVFSGNWKQAWENIKDIFKRVFSGLVDLAKKPLNAIISAFNSIISVVNGVIDKINGISFTLTVPDWIPGVGGSWWQFGGFDIPHLGTIPFLAQGAVIPPNAPFFAMLGDQRNGTNLEAPEGLIRQIMREELSGLQNNGANYQFTAQINRRTLFDEFIEEAKVRQMATGKNPLELA